MQRSVLAAITLCAAAAGCEWFSTMSDPVSIQAHEREPLQAPDHAVPLDGHPEYDLTTAEAVLSNPPPVGEHSIVIGESYYQAFCAVCHGESGLGDGPVSGKFPAIPSIVTARVTGYADAYIFALITQGRGLMPPYARIPQAARWDIVHYLRTLETGQAGAGAGAADTTAPGAQSP